MMRNSKTAVRLMAPKGRPPNECPKCRTRVVRPSLLVPEEAAAFADASRRATLEGARYAHEKLALDLRAAKALPFHITRTKSICQRCKSQLSGANSVSATCHSAKL